MQLCRECFYHAFEEEVHETIKENKMFTPGERIAVAASGGKDSTVLAHVMTTLNARHEYAHLTSPSSLRLTCTSSIILCQCDAFAREMLLIQLINGMTDVCCVTDITGTYSCCQLTRVSAATETTLWKL